MKTKDDVKSSQSKGKKVVVKIGTGVLTTDDGYVDRVSDTATRRAGR